MKFTNNNQIFMSVFLTLYALLVFLGACHVRECIGDYFMKVIAHLYILKRIFLSKKDKQWNK